MKKINKKKQDKINKKVKQRGKTPVLVSEPKESSINSVSKKVHLSLRRLWSNLHFSLALRISLHYARQLMRTTFRTLLVVTIAFIIGCSAYFSQITQEYEQVYLYQGTEKMVSAAQADPRIRGAQFIPAENLSPEDFNFFNRLVNHTFVLSLPKRLTLTISTYVEDYSGLLLLSYPINNLLFLYFSIFIGLLLADFLRVLTFVRRRKNLEKTVLKPVKDISDLAATLSASNLSNRINTAGTKNELKDLSITINHMLDRIERSYNSQKQFVSDASHELRTPIAVIQGYVQMLNRWGKNDKAILDEGLEAIAQETESMKDLVENLLFLARHDKKTLLLEMEEFDPCEIVSALHRESLLVSPDHEYTFLPQDHCIIYGDKNMIKQAMRILVDNAIKYSPVGSTIQLGIAKGPDGCVFSVSDQGEGMTKDEMKQIFNRFYRSDEARSSKASGHGLGLSIARIIVNAHKGVMKVKSKPDSGSTFSIILPYN